MEVLYSVHSQYFDKEGELSVYFNNPDSNFTLDNYRIKVTSPNNNVKIYNETTGTWVGQNLPWSDFPVLSAAMKLQSNPTVPLTPITFQLQHAKTGEVIESSVIQVYSHRHYIGYIDALNANMLTNTRTFIAPDLLLSGSSDYFLQYLLLLFSIFLILINKHLKKVILYLYDYIKEVVASRNSVPFYIFCLVFTWGNGIAKW